MTGNNTFHRTVQLGIPLAILLASPTYSQQEPQQPDQPVVFRVDVVSRTTKAINYHHRQGSTVVALEGTSLATKAAGEVKVTSKTGATQIDAIVDKLPPATAAGEGYLTYVLWAITPEGRAANLGELMLNGDGGRLQAATELQTFGLIVTAEPYYAVSHPSDFVVMEGAVKQGTAGTIMPVEAKFELIERGGYLRQLPAADRVRLREAKNVPLDILEARHAVAIARAAGADRYALDTMKKADVDLYNAESMLTSGQDKKKIQTLSRHVTQLAEDARLISVRRTQEDALAAERAENEQRAARLTQTAELESQKRLEAERAAEAKRREAELAQSQAQTAQLRAETAQQQALQAELARKQAAEQAALERARQEALQTEVLKARELSAAAEREREIAAARQRELEAETSKAREAVESARKQAEALERQASEAKLAAEKAEAERARMRAELSRQLNMVLATRESARGLIVNMSDVLFDTGRHELKPLTREKLARIAGILLAHPDLKVEVEGHTDSTGSDELNQRLSERRADSVRAYLVNQGIAPGSIVARGFGKANPVADNATVAGRQQNRRVELVVNGPQLANGDRAAPPANSQSQ